MGCGKSKHAVETATTVIKSTNADGTKQTTTATATKTVKETTTGTSLIQKESFSIEDTNKKPVTDPSGVTKTESAAPALGGDVQPARILEDVKVKASDKTDNVAHTSAERDGELVKGDGKVNDLSLADVRDVSTLVPTSSKDDVGTTEVVKEDERRTISVLKVDNNAETDDAVTMEDDKTKESNLATDNKTKNEFLTPTLSEEVVGPFDVTKGNEEVKDSKEETITSAGSDEKSSKTIDSPSNPKDDNLKLEEQKLVVQTSESTKVEAKKDAEVVEVTKVDTAKVKISPAIETEKVPAASEATVAESQKIEP